MEEIREKILNIFMENGLHEPEEQNENIEEDFVIDSLALSSILIKLSSEFSINLNRFGVYISEHEQPKTIREIFEMVVSLKPPSEH